MADFYCNVSVAAVYAEASNRSEMVTQLLYGENFSILERNGDFSRIISEFDEVEGWISHLHVSENDSTERFLLNEPFGIYEVQGGKSWLSVGSQVAFKTEDQQSKLVDSAKSFLNVPFLQGGRSFFGLDASAFTQLVYKVSNINLPRFAQQQALSGRVLDFIEEAKPGDLAFFENENGQIVHVGILLNSAEIIHVYGKVRVDALDYAGIYNQEAKKHTHKLRFIKSYF